MTGRPSKNFHGVGIGPLSKILAVKQKILSIWSAISSQKNLLRICVKLLLKAAKLYVVRAFFRSLLFTALILHGKHFSCKKMIQYHKSAGFRNCITAIVVFYQTNGTKVKIDRLVHFIYEPFFKPAVGLNIFNLRATIAAMNDPLYKYQFKYRNIYTVDNYRQITCISTGEKFAFSYTGTAQKLHRHRLQVLKVQITYS